jgi:hypothetical protein
VAELCRRAGWELEHEMLPPPGSLPPRVEVHEKYNWAFTVTEQKPAVTEELPAVLAS